MRISDWSSDVCSSDLWSLQRAPWPCRSPRASSLRARSPPPTSCPRTEGEDMALFNFLNRKRPALDGASDEGVYPVASDLPANEAVRRKQRLLLAGVSGAGVILPSFRAAEHRGGQECVRKCRVR